MLDELEGPGGRASREFRQKFPDEIVTDNLGGQLWFGAECLAAGSSIMNKVLMPPRTINKGHEMSEIYPNTS